MEQGAEEEQPEEIEEIIEEVEVAEDLPEDHDTEVGGGIPYKGRDGQVYKRWNGASYALNNRKMGYLANKVKFMLSHPEGGRVCAAQCRMPKSLRAPDDAQEISSRDDKVPDDADLDADPDVEEAGGRGLGGAQQQATADQEDGMLELELEEGLEEVHIPSVPLCMHPLLRPTSHRPLCHLLTSA